MIPNHKTNKLYLAEKLKEWYPKIASNIESVCNEFNFNHVDYLENTKDIWARDYMPIQISKDKFVEYRYDPDYLLNKRDRKYKTYTDIVCDKMGFKTIKTDIILDGGNIVKSENSIILTDKIVTENHGIYNKKDLVKELHELFEVDKVILIPKDKYCKFGHADGMLRFIDNENVLISGFYENIDLEFKKELLKPLEKAKINYDWLKVSDKETEANSFYINFLQTKDFILVPAIDESTDAEAVKQIAKFYKDYISPDRIRTIDMKDTIVKGGALNCVSWNIKTNN